MKGLHMGYSLGVVEDIRNAVTFLQQQEAVDANRIGLLGVATGGANVSYVAAVDQRIKCMVSANGMGDLGRWMRSVRRYWEWVEFNKMLDADRVQRVLTGKSRLVEQKEIIVNDPESAQTRAQMEKQQPDISKTPQRLLSLESAEAIINFRPEMVVDRISPRAAMWICAENDTLVPPEEPQSMFQKAGEPKKLATLNGENHHGLYTGNGFKKMMICATEWFDTYLKHK